MFVSTIFLFFFARNPSYMPKYSTVLLESDFAIFLLLFIYFLSFICCGLQSSIFYVIISIFYVDLGDKLAYIL